MTTTHDALRCPTCKAMMQHGYLPVSDGLVFVRGDGKAANAFAEDLPGTHAVMRSNRLPAWRCKACEMVVFQYGREIAKQVDRRTGLDDTAGREDGGRDAEPAAE